MRLFFSLSILFASSLAVANAQYLVPGGTNATRLWGQSTFTLAPTGTTASKFNGPSTVAVDPTTGKFFVADTNNNRVLRFASAAAFTNGAGAEAVLGQANFTTVVTGIATGMNAPKGVVADKLGNLWVADTGNNRVIRFANAATITSTNTFTSFLGQPLNSTNTQAVGQSGMNTPSAVTIDGNGSLYVADTGNNRVLRFLSPSTKTNGLADGVFGQPGPPEGNFLANTADKTAFTLNQPSGLIVDASGNLWIADTTNNRVLFYSSIASQGNGVGATIVLGQIDFNSNTQGLTQTTMKTPRGLAVDPFGRLYVADTGNNRVLVFETPTSASTNAKATFVLGQPNFISGGASLSQAGLNAPGGLAFSQGQLWTADTNYHRVLSYTLTTGVASFIVPSSVKLSSTKKKNVTFYVLDTTADDKFTLKVTIPSGTKKLATLKFTDSTGADVTKSLTSGSYNTGLVGPNTTPAVTTLPFKVQITPTSKAASGGNVTFTIVAASTTSGAATQQQFKAKINKSKKAQ